ncbi:MAG TPA: hypothetical protein VNU47_01800, partial [Candidatus Paceibacterota bacterium]|nr:hypothetical protein [Candidatus Paceibacterota bacterium]
MNITYTHLNRFLVLAGVAFAIFLLWSSAAYACGYEVVCSERDGAGNIPAGESLTNGCLSGVGHVEQTDCAGGGSDGGGDGGGGGGGGGGTPMVVLTATPTTIEQGR